jgi:hypothetical protein
VFGEFPVFDTDQINNRDRHLFASRCHALEERELALVGAAKRSAECRAVAFCKNVFNREMNIWEGDVKLA